MCVNPGMCKFLESPKPSLTYKIKLYRLLNCSRILYFFSMITCKAKMHWKLLFLVGFGSSCFWKALFGFTVVFFATNFLILFDKRSLSSLAEKNEGVNFQTSILQIPSFLFVIGEDYNSCCKNGINFFG